MSAITAPSKCVHYLTNNMFQLLLYYVPIGTTKRLLIQTLYIYCLWCTVKWANLVSVQSFPPMYPSCTVSNPQNYLQNCTICLFLMIYSHFTYVSPFKVRQCIICLIIMWPYFARNACKTYFFFDLIYSHSFLSLQAQVINLKYLCILRKNGVHLGL